MHSAFVWFVCLLAIVVRWCKYYIIYYNIKDSTLVMFFEEITINESTIKNKVLQYYVTIECLKLCWEKIIPTWKLPFCLRMYARNK